MIGFGLGVLRLSPHAFWAMTPIEIASAAAGIYGPRAAPPDAATLAALRTRFPD